MIHALLLCFGIFFSSFLQASSISVAPTRIDLSSDRKIATLTVSNPNEEPILIQTELLHWSQENGNDVYKPTDAVIALPSAFSIPGGKRQQIRIALENRPTTIEGAYRLFLREVPSNQPSYQSSRLKIALRIGVPIFIKPTTESVENVEWRIIQQGKTSYLKINNMSNTHVFIDELELLQNNGNTSIKKFEVFKYILPNQSYQWALGSTGKPTFDRCPIKTRINGKPMVYQAAQL